MEVDNVPLDIDSKRDAVDTKILGLLLRINIFVFPRNSCVRNCVDYPSYCMFQTNRLLIINFNNSIKLYVLHGTQQP